jgi:hypothetical protein
MRRLTQNELRLALLFGAAVFIALNLLGGRLLLEYRASILRDITSQQTAIAEGTSWIESAGALGSAREWLAAHPAPEASSDSANTGLLDAARSVGEKEGLKVLEETLLPPPQVASGNAAALQLKLAGPFAAVTRFLFEIQGPTLWRAIPRISVRSDAEPPNVVVDMEIRQYYRPVASGNGPAGP